MTEIRNTHCRGCGHNLGLHTDSLHCRTCGADCGMWCTGMLARAGLSTERRRVTPIVDSPDELVIVDGVVASGAAQGAMFG